MLCNRALLLSILLAHVQLAISQTCIFKDGSIATGYAPCKAEGISGPCCHTGDACLESGLCFGRTGLIYRGGCVDSWDTGDCLSICSDYKDVRYHANLYPCNEGTGADNPENWWCGSTTLKTCSPDEGTLFEFKPGNVAKIVPYASSSKTVESPAETTSPTSKTVESSAETTSPISTSPSSTPSSSDPTGVAAKESACPIVEEKAKLHLANMMAAVGAGVGVPLLALALAFIGLFVKERRLRKKLTVAKDVDSAGAAYGSDKGTYQIQDYGQGQDQRQIQSEYKAENEMFTGREYLELGGHHPVHELTGGHQRPIRGSIHELGSNYR